MRVKKYLLVILTTSITISVIIPTTSYAEEQNISDTPVITITRTEEIRKANYLQEIRPTILKQQEEMKKKIEEQKLLYQEQMKKKREEIMQEVEEKVKTKHDTYQASREAFMQKMKTIRDENKQKILEKLDTMIKEVNTRQTDSFSKAIDKLSGILDEMEKRGPVDDTAARTAILEAKSSIAAQAAKEYVITISTEEGLRASVGSTRKQLEMDLKTTRESVKKAKDAVLEVARELAKTKKQHILSITPKPLQTVPSEPSSTP